MRLSKFSLFFAFVLLVGVQASAFAQSTALSVIFSADRMEFSNDGDQVLQGTMTNTSDDTVVISFARRQALPKGWSTSVCFGTSCYASQIDTAWEAFGPHETRELILHVNPRMVDQPDSGWVYVRIRAETGVISDTASILVHAFFIPGEPPIIFQKIKSDSGQVFTGNGPFAVSATFQNRSADTVKFRYHLDAHLPAGWTSTLCIRDSCGATDILYPMASLVSQAVRMRMQNTSGPSLTAPDSAVFYLTVLPRTKNSADSQQFRFVAKLMPPAGVESIVATPLNTIMLGSVYPNPVNMTGQTGEVAFTVRSGRAAHGSFVLYDVAGKVVLQISFGQIEEGMSSHQISLRNVEPGAYFARISDGSALSNPVLVRVTR